MDGIREITVIFCGAAVMAAALRLLCGNRLEKSGRYIGALIMRSAIVSGIAGARVDLSLPDASAATSEDTALAISEYQAEALVTALLNEQNVAYGKVLATATKSDEGGIIINEIKIEGAADKNKILAAVRAAGIDCAVVFS